MLVANASAVQRVNGANAHLSVVQMSVLQSTPTMPLMRACRRGLCLALIAPIVSGCWGSGSLGQPDRVFPADTEIGWVQQGDPALFDRYLKSPSMETRNDFITARMYAIDMAYTNYEASLTHEGQEVNFLTTLANLGLDGAATLVPVVQTKNLLTQISMGVTGVDSAYNDKILLKQTMQHIQTGMRTARYEQAAIILGNMQCKVRYYPIGMALSDLELYYRAGTLTSGLMKVTENVTNANTDAKAGKESQGASASPAAVARLSANATDAGVKAANAGAGCATAGNGQGVLPSIGNGARSLRLVPRTN
jgi:hypothetical protein